MLLPPLNVSNAAEWQERTASSFGCSVQKTAAAVVREELGVTPGIVEGSTRSCGAASQSRKTQRWGPGVSGTIFVSQRCRKDHGRARCVQKIAAENGKIPNPQSQASGNRSTRSLKMQQRTTKEVA